MISRQEGSGRRLPGAPNLIHIDWMDYFHGLGNYRTNYYLVVHAAPPHATILRGEVLVSGHCGGLEGLDEGYYRIRYSDGTLRRIIYSRARNPATVESSIYNVYNEDDGVEDPESCYDEVEISQEISVTPNQVSVRQTRVRHLVRVGDTLEKIRRKYDISSEFINNPESIHTPGEWMNITLPGILGEKQFPLQDRLDW